MKKILLLCFLVACPLESFAAQRLNARCRTIRDNTTWEDVQLKGIKSLDDALKTFEKRIKKRNIPYDGIMCLTHERGKIYEEGAIVKNEKGKYDPNKRQKNRRTVSKGKKGFKYEIEDTTSQSTCGSDGSSTYTVLYVNVIRNGKELAKIRKPPAEWYPNAVKRAQNKDFTGGPCLEKHRYGDDVAHLWKVECSSINVGETATSFEEAFATAKKICTR